MESLKQIDEKWDKWLSKKPKKTEKAAGIEKLSWAGHMATVDALAGGDVLRYDAVLRLPISTALFKLKYDRSIREYQERLMEVTRPVKPGKAKPI